MTEITTEAKSTKVEMFDYKRGKFKSMSNMGAKTSGVFPSITAANRYARRILRDQFCGSMRITVQGKPSYILYKNNTTDSRILRTNA